MQFDGALMSSIVKFEVEDVSFVEQNSGHLLLHIRSWNLHDFVTGHLRIADASQVICYRISIHNLQSNRGLPTCFLNSWDFPRQRHLTEQYT